MAETADHVHQSKSTASPAPAGRSASTPQAAPGQALSNFRQGSMSPADVMQLQRSSGNQAVLQLFRDRSAAAPGTQAPIQRQITRPGNMFQSTRIPPVASTAATPAASIAAPSTAASVTPVVETPARAESSASSPAADVPAVRTPPNLQGRGGYGEVYSWLKAQASSSKKTDLFGFFDTLSPEQKMSAIRAMAGSARAISVDAVKKTMMSGFISKSVDWDKFSVIVREAKKIDTTNYNADQDRDYASYAAIGTSSAAGGVSGSSTISQTLGAAGAKGTALVSAPIAGGLGGVAAVSQIYNASQNYDGALSAAGKAQVVAGEGAGGAADLARVTAGTVNSVRQVSGMALNGAATAAAGAGAMIGGAAYMAGGAAGYIEGRRNVKRMGEVEERLAGQSGELAEQQRLAAGLGKSTQEMNKSKSGMTAVKGALMVAGGVALIAAAASPAGPILIALGAILGGVAAIVKFYKKHKRKEAFVDKALKVDEAMASEAYKGLARDKVRQSLLEKHGFNSLGQCYNQLVTDLAGMLYESGVVGDDQESRAIIENIGLKIDKAKKKPGKDLIAKKLHT